MAENEETLWENAQSPTATELPEMTHGSCSVEHISREEVADANARHTTEHTIVRELVDIHQHSEVIGDASRVCMLCAAGPCECLRGELRPPNFPSLLSHPLDTDSDASSESNIVSDGLRGARLSSYWQSAAQLRGEVDCAAVDERAAQLAETSRLVQFAAQLSAAKNVIVMIGAGVSVASGIPDFRTPGTGLYSQLQEYNLPFPEAIFDIDFFQDNPAPFYRLCTELWPGNFSPTYAHYFLKLLHDKAKLRRVYSQNIDSLECAAGLPAEKLVAAHGNFDSAHVVGGNRSVPIECLEEALKHGEEGWRGLEAKFGGLVKPSITFFGEALPERFRELLHDDFDACDLLIVMGTSLKVRPFNLLIGFVGDNVPRLLVNREPVGEAETFCAPGGFDFSGQRDVFLRGECDEGVRQLADLVGWKSTLDALADAHASERRADSAH